MNQPTTPSDSTFTLSEAVEGAAAHPDLVDTIFANQAQWLFRLATGSLHPPVTSSLLCHHHHLHAARTGRSGVILALPEQPGTPSECLDRTLGWLSSTGCGDVLIWSARINASLDRQLRARGAGSSFLPHWMWREITEPVSPPTIPPKIHLSLATSADLADLVATHGVPYAQDDQLREMLQLASAPSADAPVGVIVARESHLLRRSQIVGITAVNLIEWEGKRVAGLFNLGVHPDVRGRGIGTALTLSALAFARQHGASAMGLNATPDGERVYRHLGFQSIGHGQTWFMTAARLRHRPGFDLVTQAEALAMGDIERLDSVIARIGLMPNGETPIAFAAHFQQTSAARWLLDRGASADILSLWKLGLRDEAIALMTDPAALTRVAGPNATTPLHDAVDLGDIELARFLIASGADLSARDRQYHATPQDWARVLNRPEIAALIAEAAR
ncbi:MAG: GNAT family N-acetyltransferase [Thermomicrobiales bacterium]